MTDAQAMTQSGVDALITDYAPYPDSADELIDAGGRVRTVWAGLLAEFARLGPDGLRHRTHRAAQYLRDAGVFFRAYGKDGPTERAWPLSHVPVLLPDQDWQKIRAGLEQRADLLEEIVADLYGPAKLVQDGHLPAALVARMPDWLRPMVGIKPRSGHYLHFIAFEIGRGPDGNWWVLGDRTQAPSGAGFAIENRVAMSRMLPESFAGGRIARLGGFFRDYRHALEGLAAINLQPGERPGEVGVLTPGLLNEAYFEHAYISRYLGFILLEGEDLVVRDGRVMVRTVAGLRPVSVLWRRLDASYADPLELEETSRLGTPGLVGALREEAVTIVNALGSGLLETRAMLAFMPRICLALRGEPLLLPNIATWWCGQATEREHVKAHTAKMMIGPALSTRLPFDPEATTALGGQFRAHSETSVNDWIDSEGGALVGQEAVRLSTTPALLDGKLVPRPMSLRVFAARTENGWVFMPGGYARIGQSEDPTAISLQQGGSVADVWVIRDRLARGATIAEVRNDPKPRGDLTVLPSRAADNLYWLGRYVERAEGSMRLLRAYHARLSESAEPDTALLKLLDQALWRLGVNSEAPIPEGLLDMISAAENSAAQVRDRFSEDGWIALTELRRTAERSALELTDDRQESEDAIARVLGALLRQVTGFSGLVQDNMYRFTGWRFLSIGRCLERASGTASVLAQFTEPEAPEGVLDLAVEYADSAITHRRRFTIESNRNTVIDLIALDGRNPRSVLYQLNRIRALASRLPGAEDRGHLSDFYKSIIRSQTDLELSTAETLDPEALWGLRAALSETSDLLSTAYLR
ncbi:MAG: circularly permuted type 2 ATP-grasp protein [Pseudomonadota bacterium]